MDTTDATGEGRTASDTAPRNRPSPLREDGAKDPFSERTGGPQSGGDTPPPRPYTLTPVETLDQAIACAEWITKRAGETIGISMHVLGVKVSGLGAGGKVVESDDPQYWGFATDEEGWEMAELRGTAEEVIRESLKKSLTENGGLNLVMQDAATTIPILSEWLNLPAAEIAPRVVGDMTAMLHATGKVWSRPTWSWAADDAYDTLVTEKHFKLDAPAYYSTVGLPRALSTFSRALASDAEGTAWRISYDDLLLKVVAHYTREPVMVRAFMDEQDPVPRMGGLLGIEDLSVAYAALVWSALNWDTMYVKQHHPDVFKLLPLEIDSLRQGVEAKLSVLSLGLSRVREDYTRGKSMSSLLGRTFHWGAEEMGQVYEHRFMGSVSDIIDLLVVTLQQNFGENVSVEDPVYSAANRVIIIKGRIAPSQEHAALLKSVANLGNPLGVPLNQSIIIGD